MFGEWFEDVGITYVMLLPNFILFLAFVVYPIIWTLRYMMFDYNGVTAAKFTGITNFIKAFHDAYWWNAVMNTLRIAGLKLLIEIPLAMILAVLLNTKIKGKSFFRGAYFLPTVTSMATMSLAFSFMFSPYNGIINMLLKNWGLISENISFLENPTSAFITVVIISVWSVFGQNVLLILSGLQNIPEEIYESAAVDGANKVHIFFKMTIPMILPIFKIILMLAIIGSLGIFDPIYLITNGGPNHATDVMATNIYGYYFNTGSVPQYGYGATLSFISSIIIGIITVLYMRLQKKED
ncbi:MAG: sugar ABC transporter permease [Clostridia bacterium]|nr:sugar ABC transporter permease [Clostridia bacterium]